MRTILSDVRSGVFAKEWIAEMDAGEPHLAQLREQAASQLLEQVGPELRALMRREASEVKAG
jgi:ketol-acid reductoisomerase